jgi:SAM-dependent methyltransferase
MTVLAVNYGRQFAEIYGSLFPSGAEADQTVERLADLHVGGDAPALEFGVGTGRIALPLADRIGEVIGVDASPDMLDVLRRTLVGRPRRVTPVLGDIAAYGDDREYGLVYCVCGTLSMLLDPADQQRAVTAAAHRLAPGAVLVIETHNPGGVEALHAGRARESFFTPYPGPDTGLVSYSTLDADLRLWQVSHIWFDTGRARIANEVSRLTTTEEIDRYAEVAGLERVERHSDWHGTPYRADAPMQICVYRRRGSG